MPDLEQIKRIKEVKAIKHENWTQEIINDSKVGEIINNKMDSEKIASIFQGDSNIPRYLRQIVSSQLDADRMDYLLRDSHFSGVAIGNIDHEYLIKSLRIIKHGEEKTLGIALKGVKVYETFSFARHMMNRVVYFHPKVRVFEYMMEQVISKIIYNYDELEQDDKLKHILPKYFKNISDYIKLSGGGSPEDTAEENNTKFIKKYLSSYLDLTEDCIWQLLKALSKKKDLSNKPELKILHDYSDKLLNRDCIEFHQIQVGKENLADRLLKQIKDIKKGEDFEVLKLKSTLYEMENNEKVFVLESEDKSTSITKVSRLISSFHSQPEIDHIVVFLKSETKEMMDEILKQSHILESVTKSS